MADFLLQYKIFVLIFPRKHMLNNKQKVIKMKKSDIVAMRHPTSTEPDMGLSEVKSYAIVVSLVDAAENMRIAQERFMKTQLENLRPF